MTCPNSNETTDLTGVLQLQAKAVAYSAGKQTTAARLGLCCGSFPADSCAHRALRTRRCLKQIISSPRKAKRVGAVQPGGEKAPG